MQTLRNFISALGLVVADICALGLSYIFAGPDHFSVSKLLVLLCAWIVWFCVFDQQYLRRHPFWSELFSLIKGAVLFIGSSILASLLVDNEKMFLVHLRWLGLLVIFLLLYRALMRAVLNQIGIWSRPAVIFGAGENARQAELALLSERSMGYKIRSFMVPNDVSIKLTGDTPRSSWPEHDAEFEALRQFHCIIALEASQSDIRDKLIRQLSHYKIKGVSVIPSMRGVPLFGLAATHFFSHEVLMIHVNNKLLSPAHRLTKRLFDLICASFLILLLSPLMLWVAYMVWRSDGTPVIFSQPRLGKGLNTFKFYKFRSMVSNAEEMLTEWEASKSSEWQEYTTNNFKLANDPRLLRIGPMIRRTSIDELPQLFNVVMGHMSLVGPRPLLPREKNEYGEDISLYGQTPPGLTGLWQVSGRSETTFDDRVAFDSWYVKNWSLWIDIAILFKTLSVVFKRNGAY